MKLELNREYPEPEEEQKIFEEMKTLLDDRAKYTADHMNQKLVAEGKASGTGCPVRRQHVKPTGCVRGVFKIRDDLPDYLAHGVFRQPGKTFEAIVRFSNSSDMPSHDGAGAARGMAIKLLDVDGKPAIEGTNERCQDFLMVNHPVFPFATPAEYKNFFKLRNKFGGGGIATTLAAVIPGVAHPTHVIIGNEIKTKKVGSPLEIRYWSGSPYWLGPDTTTGGRAVKYSVVPTISGTPLPVPLEDTQDKDYDYLVKALASSLKTHEVAFDFCVQLQTDPDAMPVEDVSVLWDEGASGPVRVATLTIGVQDVRSAEGIAFAKRVEEMAFSPWNALAAHRPMGGINRLRKAVYLASQTARAAKGASH